MSSSGFEKHDHSSCVATSIKAAEDHCAQNKLQLTPVRRRVLEILLEGHKALGAYDILPHLAAEGLGSQPPVVYRALDFLQNHGLVHKVEKLNAWTACMHPGEAHNPAFMICSDCDLVAEIPASPGTGDLGRAADQMGFTINTAVIEIEGTCPSCRDNAGTDITS